MVLRLPGAFSTLPRDSEPPSGNAGVGPRRAMKDMNAAPGSGESKSAESRAQLAASREDIDRADRALVTALADRLRAVRRIGEIKAAGGASLVDPGREAVVEGAWTELAGEAGLDVHAAGRVLGEVLEWSRREQEPSAAVGGHARVAYQGAPGANSDLVARRLMGLRRRSCAPIGYRSFDAVVAALSRGEVDYALLPVENSLLGNIEASTALLSEGQLVIVDEEKWAVKHALAVLPGAGLAEVQRVISHPVALRQCRRTLSEELSLGTEEVWDTAGAAQMVALGGDPTRAAVCPADAARAHGLEVVRDDVSDHPDNWTRFLLLAREAEPTPKGIPCRTTVRFIADHAAGSLARCLGAFESMGVNLTRLASHVLPQRPGQYGFIADLEGHIDDPSVAEALGRVRAASRQLSVLGSYPDRMGERGPVKAPGAVDDLGAVDDSGAPGAPLASGAPAQTPAALPVPAEPRRPKGTKGLSLVEGSAGGETPERMIAGVGIGPDRFLMIAGPCAVESEAQIEGAADMVHGVGASMLRGGAFKPRTSTYSFQGLGLPGLDLLKAAGSRRGLPVVTEVLTGGDVESIARTADVLQIGARNMQNFELLRTVGMSDRPVLLKRGMSATVEEWLHAAEYILAAGNQQVILCERGIRTFETSTRATLDIASVAVVKERTHLPVIVDPSHAAGRRELVVPLALAAAAAGADGLIVECHPDRENAQCDKAQALTHDDMRALMTGLQPILDAQGRRLA